MHFICDIVKALSIKQSLERRMTLLSMDMCPFDSKKMELGPITCTMDNVRTRRIYLILLIYDCKSLCADRSRPEITVDEGT
jgi:hypothetical protein